MLDCKDFGSKFVMTGIFGKHGQGIDRLGVRCTEVTSTGAVETGATATVKNTDTFGGTAGDTFTPLTCPAGQAVVGIRGTMEREQIRGLGIQCQTLTGGLATGAITNRGLVGGTAPGPWPPDNCGNGRPARAIRAGRDLFHSGIPLGNLFAPYVIAAVQLYCEQPAQ
jgi:hypothetical protein